MRSVFLCFVAAALFGSGCASKAPPWHGGFLDSVSGYYEQGTGGGDSIQRADRNAQIALVGYQQGVQIENITEDQVQSFQKNGDELLVEVMTSKGVQRINGTLPPGSYIAERWQDGNGYWWSFAVSEREGQGRNIQRLRDQKLGSARLRSFVPGLAQFAKGQKSKGWRIVWAEGVGLVGLATAAILQQDYKDRRDRARFPADVKYYDDRANWAYWGTVAFGTLAGGTYLYNLIDGFTSVPPTYRLLLSGGHWDLQPRRDGLALVYQYDFD